MGKFFEALGEYFFGAKMKKYYEMQKYHTVAFAQTEKDKKGRLKNLKTEKSIDFFFGKHLPNLIDLGAIMLFVATKEPPVYIIVGEIFRNYWDFFMFRPRKKTREKLTELEKKTYCDNEKFSSYFKKMPEDKPPTLDNFFDDADFT